MGSARRSAGAVAFALAAVAAQACSSGTGATAGVHGDNLDFMADASTGEVPPKPDPDGGSYYEDAGFYNSPSYGSISASFQPQAWCGACGCPVGSSCSVSPAGSGPASCASTAAAAAGYQVSCVALSGICDASDCSCLLQGLQGQGCYADCTANSGVPILYCLH